MNFIKNINRVEKLHSLILKEKTGTPKELAESLGISRATSYVLIDELNSLNMPVSYSRKHEAFYYKKETKQTFSIKEKNNTDQNNLMKIN